MVYFIMTRLGFSLELCHVFPRAATDLFVHGLKFWDFSQLLKWLSVYWLFGQEKSILIPEHCRCESQLISY